MSPSQRVMLFDTDSKIVIDKIVKGYNGVTLAGNGIPYLVALVDQTGQTGNIITTTLITPGSAGFYRLSIALYANVTIASAGSINVGISWKQNGHVFSNSTLLVNTGSTGFTGAYITENIYSDASYAIAYAVTVTGTATFTYDLHIRLEAM